MSDQEMMGSVANYLCELDRQVNVTKAPFEHSNAERRAMFLARAEDMFRSVPALTRLQQSNAALVEALRCLAGPTENGEAETAVPHSSRVKIDCELGDLRRAWAALATFN
jgi:hypothetical protein